jgi:hypothetical protein
LSSSSAPKLTPSAPASGSSVACATPPSTFSSGRPSRFVRVHLVPRIGQIRLQNLTRPEVKALYAQLRKDGIARFLPSGSPSSRRSPRYRELREGPNPRAAVSVMVAETGRPEATLRHWIRGCDKLGLLGKEPRPAGKGRSPKSV